MIQQQGTFQTEISQHVEKLHNTYAKITTCLDKMLQEYSQAEESIAEGIDPLNALQKLNQQLLDQRPIKSVREHYVHHYRKLSNIIRKIGARESRGHPSPRHSRKRNSEANSLPKMPNPKQQRFERFVGSKLRGKEDRECLKTLLVEHMLREGQWQEAAVFGQMEKEIDPNDLFRECFALKEGVRSGEMQEAIRWCQAEKLFETHQILLEYELKKTHIIGLVHKGKTSQALSYYASNMGKFHQHKQSQIEMLVICLLTRGQPDWFEVIRQDKVLDSLFKDRYASLEYSQKQCNQLAQEVGRQYLKHNKLSQFDAFKIIYEAAGNAKGEFRRLMGLLEGSPKSKEDDSVLPFSIGLPKQNQYHSLFLCPITKQVSSSGEKSMVLSCGHLISEGAHIRIMHQNRNRRRVKCPICLKEIKPQDSLKVQF